MSGAEFERFMANVYTALGFDVKILGGSGDQGVDLLLRTGREAVAIQCKNHKRPVGNSPIQQVFAGQRHYRTNQAWVVAPAGFTKGAFELARTTGVRLFDYGSIEQWIRQVEQRIEEQRANEQRVRELQAEQRTQEQQAEVSWTQKLRALLFGRQPEEQSAEAQQAEERQEREQRAKEQREKEQRGKERRTSAEITNPGNQGPADPKKQGSSFQANVTASGNYTIGDTATMPTGDRLTVHSYESAIPSTRVQPEEGYEFSAIDVEWCADPHSGGTLRQAANSFDFYLHMPDNTRLRRDSRRIKQPALPFPSPYLEPADCVRGWITYQTPQGAKPKFIIFSKEVTVVKWAVP